MGIWKQWAVFICMEGWGWVTIAPVITHTQYEDTQKCNHTYKWVEICKWGVIGVSLGEIRPFVWLFFLLRSQNTTRGLTYPLVWVVLFLFCFFVQRHLSSLKSDCTWYLWAWPAVHIIRIITVIMHFRGGGDNVRAGGAGAGLCTAAIIRLSWFMIYADRIVPEVTPPEELGCKNLFYPID